VVLRDGRPAHVSFRGLGGDVAAASGPWRTSGDWWREDSWQQDEWDLEIQFDVSSRTSSGRRRERANTPSQGGSHRGLYRFYYDERLQGWFVRGAYD
jgi:hypothetical protein